MSNQGLSIFDHDDNSGDEPTQVIPREGAEQGSGAQKTAQKVAEDLTANARKEAELIVKDAELLAERLISQAQQRVADLEKSIGDLRMERRAARNKLTMTIDMIQQMIALDAEEEANEEPITSMFRQRSS